VTHRMRAALLLTLCALAACSHGRSAAREGAGPTLDHMAWLAWQRGDLALASELAAQLDDRPASHHLRALIAAVTGRHEEAIAHAAKVPAGYAKRAELDKLTVNAYRHLGRVDEAARFARSRKLDPWLVRQLAYLAAQPFAVSDLDSLQIIPFAKHPMSAYIPAVRCRIDGQEGLALFDTGASFLAMTPGAARELGVKVDCGGRGVVGIGHPTEVCFGVADLEIGGLVLLNVPVETFTPASKAELVIFGTSIVQRFLWTVDYPKQRFIVSPPGDARLEAEHRALLPRSQARVPFYVWGDHYMIAHGSLGASTKLPFFVDSGLVYLYREGSTIRQAALEVERSKLARWGLSPEQYSRGGMTKVDLIELPVPLGLGPLRQSGHLLLHTTKPQSWTSLGGIEMDGLISHAFLSRYAWTIDFARREYVFSSE
jgi:hypothetical protein